MSKLAVTGWIVGAVVSWCAWMLATVEAVVPAVTSTTTEVVVSTTVAVETVAVAPASSTTTTSTTTTSLPLELTSVSYRCPEQMRLAFEVGWPVEQLSRLDRIVHRESRCDASAHNAADPNSGSYGLMQINGFWCNGSTSWLHQQGVVASCGDLFHAGTSLRAGLAIWQRSGWSPWNL